MISLQEAYRRATTGPYKTVGLGVDYRVQEYDDGIWVTFQGTCFPKNKYKWIDLLVDLDIRNNKSFCNGFRVAFDTAWSHIVDDLWSTNRRKPITISGFSLGGAIASVFSDYGGYPAVTFGAPRTRWGIKRKSNPLITHVVMPDDPIPHLAPAILGYYHSGNILKIPASGSPIIGKTIEESSHMQYGRVLKEYNL